MPECCSYRGWTLVNVAGGWRVAVRGNERIRVCRDDASGGEATREFHTKVDAFEDAR